MRELNAYGCASPIRLPVTAALAAGACADAFFPEANPAYRGGDSIVWGLIRGAAEVMNSTADSGNDYFQIDNAYFFREKYFRVTKNSLQLCKIDTVDHSRYLKVLREAKLEVYPWKIRRGDEILVCPSSEFLFGFYKTNMEAWVKETVEKIRTFTDRPIRVRKKHIGGIDEDIANAWCLVTHVSAAGLDALRMGIPVVTTGQCAASPLATPIDEIANPKLIDGREDLFATLAWGQFNLEEMRNGFAWLTVASGK